MKSPGGASDVPWKRHFWSRGHLCPPAAAVVVGDLGRITPLITAAPDGRTVLFARTDHALQDLVLVEGFR